MTHPITARINLLPVTLLFALALMLSACGGTETSSSLSSTSVTSSAISSDILYGDVHDNVANMRSKYDANPKDALIAARYGKALRESGDVKGAKTILLGVAADKKVGTLANTELSAIYLSQGEFNKAEHAARKAIQQDNNNYRAWRNLGNALDATEKYKEGETAFRKALALWTGADKIAVINNLALNLAAQGYTDQSLNMLYEAQKLDPNRVEIERNIRIIRTLNEPAIYSGKKHPPTENIAPK